MTISQVCNSVWKHFSVHSICKTCELSIILMQTLLGRANMISSANLYRGNVLVTMLVQ
jgi:hypothetical protein